MRYLVVGLLLVEGCGNACQTMCVRMAEYSEECGNTVTDAEIDACMDEMASVERSDIQTCEAYNTPDAIRREWACEDINLFR